MGHEMHLVEGFILDSNQYGESGRILKILTKDFGIVSVAATGVRELKSKMRGSMDVLQLVDFEFVEGRELNRLTGIHEKKKYAEILFSNNIDVLKKRRVVSNIVNFVLRSVVGETKNEKLWESFLEGFDYLSGKPTEEQTDIEKYAPDIVEILWLIKILISLGYWESGKLEGFTIENFQELKDEGRKTKIVLEINQAIKSTHL